MEKVVKKVQVSVPAEPKTVVQMSKIVKRESVKVCEDPLNLNKDVHTKRIVDAVVNLKKKGDILESIEIICPCGNKIEILCQYD